MVKQLAIEEFLESSKGYLTLDVRSEGEFKQGHILHATNLPLFNNEERKIVGTVYKQQGREEAILIGLDMVGKKMADFIRFAKQHATGNKIFVHCWRGGMRSGSMAWLFDMYGFEVYVLKDGYKAYRHRALDTMARKFNYLLLGGRTGCGKTGILKALRDAGEQVIDLEDLANHKGSAFGALGHAEQPSSEHFENMLAEEISKLDPTKPVWIEDESKSIGKVFLGNSLWSNMLAAPVIVIDIPVEIRLKKLVAEYGTFPVNALEQSLTNITRRLGNEQWKNAIAALHAGHLQQVAQIALHYYDKAYDKSITLQKDRKIIRLDFEEDSAALICNALLNESRKLYGN